MEIKENKILFAKVKPNAIIPTKRDEDMGFDIYACFDEDYMVIKPHETKLIPTGIASACDPKYGFLLRERGSTGSKGIALRAGVIDSGYRNEWFVGLTNTTDKTLYISKISKKEIIDMEYKADLVAQTVDALFGDENSCSTIKDKLEAAALVYPYSKAIAQALIVEVPKMKVEEISYDDLKMIESERGMTKLGASGK